MIDRYDILIEIINYLFEYTVRTHDNKISCNLVKEEYNGSSIFHIRSESFEHSKQLQNWIHNTQDNTIKVYFHQGLEEVFGKEYSSKVKFRILK